MSLKGLVDHGRAPAQLLQGIPLAFMERKRINPNFSAAELDHPFQKPKKGRLSCSRRSDQGHNLRSIAK
jgi:hypothetical protein